MIERLFVGDIEIYTKKVNPITKTEYLDNLSWKWEMLQIPFNLLLKTIQNIMFELALGTIPSEFPNRLKDSSSLIDQKEQMDNTTISINQKIKELKTLYNPLITEEQRIQDINIFEKVESLVKDVEVLIDSLGGEIS